MDIPQEARILFLVIMAFIVGIAVLILKPDYRFDQIIRSNSHYYAEEFSGQPDPGADMGETPETIGF